MQAWQYETRQGIKFITNPGWHEYGVDIGFSTRLGGFSPGGYTSLNMGLHVGDQDELVCENRMLYLGVFDAGLDDAVCCQQVHGNQVHHVERTDCGRGARDLSSAIPDCDAMVTDIAGVYLLSFYADCVPVYLFDPCQRAIGLAHCGWKGTMGRIAARVVDIMAAKFGTVPADVQVFIGPGIGSCCFTIQADLMSQVKNEFGGLHDIITNDEMGLIHWDLQQTNRYILLDAGIKSANIEICHLCTSCHPEIFYSHRRDMGMTGRMGAVLGLKY